MSDGFQSIFRHGLFDGQVMVVTGGGTGIGRCIAHELAALGAHVVLAARRLEPLETVASEIAEAGGAASTQVMNIRHEAEVDEAIKAIVETHGRIDGLVNNAGGQFASPAAMIRPKGWRAVIDTNLNGTWFVTQAVFNRWMKRNGGSVVNIVAEMWNGFPGMAHTGAARAGVVNLTKTLSIEWGQFGVRVNAVAPGTILSSGLNNYPAPIQKAAATIARKHPTARFGTESEVSAAVAFLLTPAASFMTGETMCVDGGASLAKETLVPLVPHDKSAPFNAFHLAAEIPDVFTDDKTT